jgi:hypothetical protein
MDGAGDIGGGAGPELIGDDILMGFGGHLGCSAFKVVGAIDWRDRACPVIDTGTIQPVILV